MISWYGNNLNLRDIISKMGIKITFSDRVSVVCFNRERMRKESRKECTMSIFL